MPYVGKPLVTLTGIDSGLDSIANLTTSADKMIYTTSSDTYAVTPITAFARSILDDADATTVLSTLGISAYAKTILDDTDATTALSTLGVSTYAKTILDDADAAATRTTLGLGTSATIDTGTTANKIVKLDGNAKLPAVDGSLLTGMSSGAPGLSASITVLDVKSWVLPWGYAVNGQNSASLDSAITRPSTGTYQGHITNTNFVKNYFKSQGTYPLITLRTAASGEGWKGNQFCSFNPFCHIHTAKVSYGSSGPPLQTEGAMAFMPFQVNSTTGVITIGQNGIPTMFQPKNGNSVHSQMSSTYSSVIGSYGANNYVFHSAGGWWNQGGTMSGYGHFYLNTDNTMTNLDRDANTMEWDSSFSDNSARSWFVNFQNASSKNIYDVNVRNIDYKLGHYGLPIDNTENKTRIAFTGVDSHQNPSSNSTRSLVPHSMEFSTTKTTFPTWTVLQAVGSTDHNFRSWEARWRFTQGYDWQMPAEMIQQFGHYVDENNSNTTGYNLPSKIFATKGPPYYGGSRNDWDDTNDHVTYWWGMRSGGQMIAYQTNNQFNDSIYDTTTGNIPEMGGYSWRAEAGGVGRDIPRAFHLIGQDANNPDPCIMVYGSKGQCMKVVANSGWSSSTGSSTINANGGGRPTVFHPNKAIPCDNKQYYRPTPDIFSIPGQRDTFMCIGNPGYSDVSAKTINKFRIDSTNGEITYLGSVDLRYVLEAYTPPEARADFQATLSMHPIWDSNTNTWGKILLIISTGEHEVLVTIDTPTFQT